MQLIVEANRLLNMPSANKASQSPQWLSIRDQLLNEKRKGVILLRRPPSVFQGSQLRCWASAMESWLDVVQLKHPFERRMSADDLIAKFSNSPSGSLKTAKLPRVLSYLGAAAEMKRANQATYKYFLDKLRKKGHLLLYPSSRPSENPDRMPNWLPTRRRLPANPSTVSDTRSLKAFAHRPARVDSDELMNRFHSAL